MSDPVIVGVVSVANKGGGVFELTHEAFPAPVKVRGWGKAEAEANRYSDIINAGLPVQPIDATEEQTGDDQPIDLEPAPNDVEARMAAQEAKLELQDAKLDALMDIMKKVAELQAAGITTAVPSPDAGVAAATDHNARIAVTPARFASTLPEDTLKAMGEIGIKTRRIILENNDDIPPTGLFVSHNGRAYMIMPGREVDVPDFILDVLDDAKVSHPITDPETKKVISYSTRARHPYREVREQRERSAG